MLKKIEQGGLVAWNFQKQNLHLFATASTDPDEQNRFFIKVFKFDQLDKSETPQLLTQVQIHAPCCSLAWTTFGEEYGYEYGLIILGLQDSNIVVIDAQRALENNGLDSIIHTEPEIFENLGPIETLEYNVLRPNLIAMGGEEVLVMDIKIQNGQIAPNFFQPVVDDTNPHQNSTVTAVSWNQKVPHILASASQNGITVIWDLKLNKPIKSFGGDTSGTVKDVCLAWSTEFPTCVAKSEEQQRSQEIQIWDLRNPKGPVMILEKGHNAHISCISWCSTDQSLVLTGGFDKRVICWSIKDQTQVCVEEFDEEIKDVQWSKINNLYSVTLKSGQIQLKSLHGDDSSIAPPKWYTPPVGTTFSSNGNIATFHESVDRIRVQLRGIEPSNDDFLNFDEFFEQLSEENLKLEDLCDWKLKNFALSEKNAQIWRFLRASVPNETEYLFDCLGFRKADIQKRAEDYTGKKHSKQVEEVNTQNNQKRAAKQTETIKEINEEDANDFFANLASEAEKPVEKSQEQGPFQRLASSSGAEEVFAHETISKNINWDAGVEKIIKENLIVNNFEGAIDSAMKCGRQAEALLLAYSQGTEIFEQTMKDYFVSNTDPFIKNVLRNVVYKNNKEMVEVYNLDHWKECIGILFTSVKNKKEQQEYLNILAERFIAEIKHEDHAVLCFILAGNFDRLAEIYFHNIQALKFGSMQRKTQEVLYLEILITFNQILGGSGSQNSHFNQMIYESAHYLYEDNLVLASYSVLMEGSTRFPKIANFLDLLFQSHPDKISPYYDAPTVPYKVKNLQPQVRPNNNNNNNNRGGNNNNNNNRPGFNNQKNNNFKGQGGVPPVNNFNQNKNTPFKTNPPSSKNTFNNPPPTNNAFNNPPPTNNAFNNPPPTNNAFNNPPPTNNNAFNNPPPTNNNAFNNPPPQNNNNANERQAPPPVMKKDNSKKIQSGPKYVPPPSFQNKVNNNNNQQAGGFNPNNQINQPPTNNFPPANNNINNNNNNNNVAPPPPVNNNNNVQKTVPPPNRNVVPPPRANNPPPPKTGGPPPRTGGIPPPPIRR